MHRILLLLGMVLALSGSAWALIGVPCDPERDFTEVVLLDHWKQLPHKNQEESKARVDEVNAKLGRAAWKYDPTPNHSVYECLSYGASTIADWWALEMGWKLDRYKSYAHGGTEQGFNPRKLEVRYRHRTRSNPLHYAQVGIRAEDRCPVTGEWVPIRPSGYARLLVEREPDSIVDPVDGITHVYKSTDYPMEGEWYWVVAKNHDKKGVEAKLKQALADHGPLYVQFEIPNKHLLFGTHGPVVIGWGKLASGATVFICHDSYGNFDKTHQQDDRGANAYRYVTANEIDEAIVFPHRPVVRAVRAGEGVRVSFLNRAGHPLRVRKARYLDAAGKEHEMDLAQRGSYLIPAGAVKGATVTVVVEADYYMAKGGKGYRITVPISSR